MSRAYQAGPTWRPGRQRIAPRDNLAHKLPDNAPSYFRHSVNPLSGKPLGATENNGDYALNSVISAGPPLGLWALVKWILAVQAIAFGVRRLPATGRRAALANTFVAYLETDFHQACAGAAAGPPRT